MQATAVAAPRRRSPARLALMAIGFVVSVGLILVVAFVLLDLAASHSFQTTTHYAHVRTLVVRSGAGDVTLTSAPAGGSVVVKAEQTEALFKPKVGAHRSGNGGLTLTAGCQDELECSVHYVLSVPTDVAIKVSSGFGDIYATRLTSASSIQFGTTAGGIHASELNAPEVRLATGVGGITASLAQPARSLVASTFAGPLTLVVPDTSYAVHAHAGAGRLSDGGIRIDPASPRSIDATSSLGDVTIAAR